MPTQEERRQHGYLESILVPNDPGRNEAYTNCIKCLKHNARAAVVLKPQLLPQSFLLADLVGMRVVPSLWRPGVSNTVILARTSTL